MMDKHFKERLSFSGQSKVSFENWREALALLPDPIEAQKQNQQISPELLALPTTPEANHGVAQLEWVLTEDNHSTRILLAPYFVDGITSYRVPSLNHLLNQLELSFFDRAWSLFFANHFCQDDANVALEVGHVMQTILLTLAGAKRLRLASDDIPLSVEKPLRLKARLRFSEEWGLWVLDAELVTELGVCIAPEFLDFITRSGLAAYDGGLFPLPKGASWIAQLSASGAWYIAKENLGEALYRLARRICDSEFLRHFSEVHFVQGPTLPVVYLRSKHFDKNTPITLYFAYRYGTVEVFSKWHGQGFETLPIGFDSSVEPNVLHFRNATDEDKLEIKLESEEGITFAANKRAWIVPIPALWQIIHHLLSLGWEVWAEKHKIEELSSFGVNAESGISWFELIPFDRSSGQKIDPIQLIKYLKRKALFIRLGHDRVCVLPERWIAHLSRFLDISHFEEDNGWRFSSIYASEVEGAIGNNAEFQADAAFSATVERVRSFDQVQLLAQPDGLRALLRPYQLTGLTWLNLLCELRVGGILADDMGLGKTVQILALLQQRIVNQPNLTPQTILVVCPKAVQTHWFTQASNLIPRLKCHILNPREVTIGEHRFNEHVLLLASYGLVRHNSAAFSKWAFDLLIIDEAQMIKNDSSQTTQTIKKLRAAQRFALTGTPIENRFEELVSIFTFLNPQAKLSLESKSPTADALRSLVQRALHPFVLRRLKEDVLTDLPAKTVNKVILPMPPEQARLHHELLEVYRHEMAKYQDSSALPTEDEAAFFLEGLLRLRQVATYPQQLTKNGFHDCLSNKLQYLCEKIPKLIEKHRVVVFSQFLGFLRRLAEEMRALEIRCIYVDGETPEREREIAAFQSNTAIKVLLISLRVGGVGIDLTSADLCIIADPWWNEAVEKQAVDRLHRFGQKKPVTALRLISAGSIEEKMEILKQNKSKLADALGKTSPDFLNHLKWEDFTEIF